MKKIQSKFIKKYIFMMVIIAIIWGIGSIIWKSNQIKSIVLGSSSDKTYDTGSKIKIDKLNKTQEDNLFKLCKVWGFLKYYHPNVAKGNFNWDYELFKIMPKVLQANNSDEVDKIFIKWVEALGEVTERKYENNCEKIKIQPSTGWIKDTKFISANLSEALCKIEKCNRGRQNHYSTIKVEKYPTFVNEKVYCNIKYEKDQGYRLLMLFRYWNVVEYYSPYKNIMDYSWDSVLKECIPKFINSNGELEYRLNLYELIGRVQDEHASMWQESKIDTEFFGNNIMPINVNFIEDKFVITKKIDELNAKCNIKIGDVILKIDGKDINDIIEEKLKYIPKANKKIYRNRFKNYLMRTNKNELGILIKRGNDVFEEKVNCVDYMSFIMKDYDLNIESNKLIENNIGYIYTGTLSKGEIDSVMEKFKSTKGLIIDIRCYPSTYMVYSLGKHLMERPTEVIKNVKVNEFVPGEFIEENMSVGEDNKNYYKGKVVIIVNQETMSQAEFTAMAFRGAPNAIIIGSNTVGADGNVKSIPLSPGVDTMISATGVYYADGRETQRIGIIPDIEVNPTIEGIRNGKDELLDRAIQIVNGK